MTEEYQNLNLDWGPLVTERIVPGLRWRRDRDREVLQQRFEITTRFGFNLDDEGKTRVLEWRDVPYE